MTVLDRIRKATAEVMDDLKWPGRKRMIKRATASVVDAAEEKRIDADQKLIDLRKRLTACTVEDEARRIFKEIVAVKSELDDVESVAEIARAEKAYLEGQDKE